MANAALSVVTPISGSTWSYRLELLDGKPIEVADKGVFVNLVSPEWFKTYGTKMLAGRDFATADTRGAPAVAIVNEAFARKFTGGANPLGRRVREPARPSSPNPEREIVGYVADAVYRSLRDPVPATMYLPFEQNTTAPSAASISVRSATGAPALLTRGLAAALDASYGLPPRDPLTMTAAAVVLGTIGALAGSDPSPARLAHRSGTGAEGWIGVVGYRLLLDDPRH